MKPSPRQNNTEKEQAAELLSAKTGANQQLVHLRYEVLWSTK
jgi:hypothetical protein